MRIGTSLLALAATAMSASMASAAVYNVTGGDAGEGLTLDAANVIYALDINGNSGPSGYTVQGVTFLPSYANITSLHGGNFAVGVSSFETATSSDIALGQVYSSLNYATPSNDDPITFTIGGLTAGASYEVNFLVTLGDFNDTRYDEFLINGVATGDTIVYSMNQFYNISAIGIADNTGTLTAAVHDNQPGGGGGAIVNGLVVSAVPEPASLGLLSLGMLAMGRRRHA